MTGVGRRVRPIGWQARTDGAELYTSDLDLPGTLVCRILRSPVAAGRITRLDVAAARAVPGVAAVVTAQDFPGVRYQHAAGDFSDRLPLADGAVRYVGEEIAAVAAETPEAADEALRRMRLRVRRRPAPVTVADALEDGAPALHGDRRRNRALVLSGEFGVRPALCDAAVHTYTGTYTYPIVAHAAMEPHTTMARWLPQREQLELWTSTQSPYLIEKEVAHVLGLRREQVVCREVAVGGGFGVKSKISEHEAIVGRLAIATGRPVRFAASRSEEFGATKTRHGATTTIHLGVDAHGRLSEIDAHLLMDNGAYNHYGPTVIKAAVNYLGSIYRARHVRYDAILVDTAKPPGGPFRGYGATQMALALESAIDGVAEAANQDPLDFRIANANRPDTVSLSGARVGTAGLVDCLQAVREAIGWDRARAGGAPWRGVGVACGMHLSGSYAFPKSDTSEGVVELTPDGGVLVRFGSADAGTGQRTILAQIAAEELGVEPDDVRVLSTDGEDTPYDQGSWSSRGTHYTGHATGAASRELAEQIRARVREQLGDGPVELEHGKAVHPAGVLSFQELASAAAAAGEQLRGVAEYVERRVDPPGTPNQNKSASYPFAAHAAEVEVDPLTGRIRVLRYVAAHDSGTAINPTLLEGQIRGGVVMALGAALGEELVHEHGRVVNQSYLNYALPRAGDVPDIETILVGTADPAGPYGAKSVGEVPMHPVAPAIANAVWNAAGIRLTNPPFTPDKVLTALREAGTPGMSPRDHRIWRRPSRWWVAGVRWAYPRGLHHVLHTYGTRLARRRSQAAVQNVTPATTVEAAVRELATGSTAIAGGTDLLPRRQQGLAAPERLVSIAELQGLRRMRADADGSLRIGAAVTLTELAEQSPGELAALVDAAASIASPQIRNVATVGGNLLQEKRCWFYRNGFDCYKRSGPTCPCYAVEGDHRFQHAVLDQHRCQAVTPSDLATVLAALDAVALVRGSSGTRQLQVAQLYTGPGETALTADELLEAVVVPWPARRRPQAFRKLALYQGDFAAVSVAVSADIDGHGAWSGARLVFGALGPTPWRARDTESAVEGRSFDWATWRRLLDAELDRHAHPLRRNAWKLDAAVGLALQAAQSLADRTQPAS